MAQNKKDVRAHVTKMISKFFKSNRKSKNPRENKEEFKGLPPRFNDPPVKKDEEEIVAVDKKVEVEGEIRNLGKLFVGGLDHLTTVKELETYFSRFGEVADSNIPRFPNSGKSQGFGFVTFVNPKDAKAALQTEIHVLDGKLVEVQPFGSKPANKKNEKTRIFLGGLPEDITKEHLRKFFCRYGEIVDVRIPLNRTSNKPKGIGFISFKDELAAEKCKADRFVFLRGRRVQISQAKTRDKSKSNDSLSTCSFLDNDVALVGFENEESGDNGDSQSVTSGKELIEQNPAWEAFLEKYFLEKFVNFSRMNQNNTSEETQHLQDTQITELEKLLGDFLIFSNDHIKTSGEDLMEFSDKTSGEEEEDVASTLTCNSNSSGKLNETLTKNPSLISKENSKALDDNEFSVKEKLLPLQIRNKEGFLMCSVCQWISPNDSTESFLAHCKTSLHRTNLKDRFPSEQSQQQPLEKESKPKTTPEKPLLTSLPEAKKQGAKKKKIIQRQSAVGATDKKDTTKKITNEKTVTNPKIHALAKGMTSIQPFSKDELICTMCNKKIPKALEFEVLMKNVSAHLQSKIHLKNLAETENSLKTQNDTKSTNTNCKENGKQKQKQKPEATPAEKVKKNPEPKSVVDKNKTSAVQNATKTKDSNKEKPLKNKETKADNSKLKFLCLCCNITCETIEVFNVHLKLKSHTDSLLTKNIKADVSLANMGKCKSCQKYLYGSLYEINIHCSKCLKK